MIWPMEFPAEQVEAVVRWYSEAESAENGAPVGRSEAAVSEGTAAASAPGPLGSSEGAQ